MSHPLRILWLKTGPLHPLDTGGKLRTYNMLRELKKIHHVTYLALCRPDCPEAAKAAAVDYAHEAIWVPWAETTKFSPRFYLDLLANYLGSPLPYAVAKYRSPEMTRRIVEYARSGQHDLVLCDFLTPAVNLPEGGGPRLPTVIFQHNVESLIWKRSCENAGSRLKAWYLRGQWRRMERFERQACARVQGVIGVSDEDCRILREDFHLANVLGSVPTGVDTDYFQPPAAPRRPRSLAFLGSMDWMPNIDGIVYFVEKIFPLIKAKHPDATLAIIGRNPPQKVRDLAHHTSGITVTGTVSDVRPHLAKTELLVVPLRIGGGTRIKIFEGMATGIPVVSTRIGAEGLPLTSGEHLLLADDPAEFAREVCRLFDQPALREKLGRQGLDLVRRQYGWPQVTRVFERYCGAALPATPPPPPA